MSGIEKPDAVGLLEIARRTLLDEVMPQLQGDARVKALMVANAMAIATRAAMVGEIAALPDAAGICAAIRDGRHDDDAALAELLRAHAELRCRISSKPGG